jgi:D-alanine-D-alanine ligase
MALFQDLCRLPVLMLYCSDPEWSVEVQEEVLRETRRLGLALRRAGYSLEFVPVSESRLPLGLTAHDPLDVVVFNWCEEFPGVPRSEAQVAAALDDLGFTYTGASAETIALSYDKPGIKEMLTAHGVPTPHWQMFTTPDPDGWDCFPAIVKPAWEHCSVGLTPQSAVTSAGELAQQLEQVLGRLNQPALVEDFIDGPEFHVALWGNDVLEMLPPVEMDFSAFSDLHDRVCTYDAKFVPDSRAYQGIKTIVPARLEPAAMNHLQDVAVAAYKATGCRDYGRVDIRLRDGQFYVLDINPNADITREASVAVAAAKAGYSYGEMGSRLVEFALTRHPQNLAPHQ